MIFSIVAALSFAFIGIEGNSILEIINQNEVAKLVEQQSVHTKADSEIPVHDLQKARIDLKNLLKGSETSLVVAKKSRLRKDWCKAVSFLQEINEEGCHRKAIVNKFCYGQCNSFFIPNGSAERRRKGTEMAFKSCPGCVPSRWSWITVTLSCPSSQDAIRKKKVFRVRQCQCLPMEM